VIHDYVKSGDSIRGALALRLLEQLTNPKLVDYLLPLSSDESLPPRVQVEVSDLLALNKKDWVGSADEFRMFNRWFAGAWKEKENVPWEASEEKVVAELFFQTPPFSVGRRLKLAVEGLANTSRSNRFKIELFQVLKSTESVPRKFGLPNPNPREADEGFAYLVSAIQNEKSPAKAIAAAKLVSLFSPLSNEREMIVRKLQSTITSEDIRKELELALMSK
jgi:hypothetical protein